jgi:hypothetical protein
VFLGPSLPGGEARRLLAADYRPPVRQGDLDRVEPGRVVAIIDGRLGDGITIGTDEICRAMRRGLAVYGAASTGALRAAELHDRGMRGVGWVYEAYRSGCITSADEVAVLYAPDSLRPLTVPLVNVRCWLAGLVEAGRLDAEHADRAMTGLRALDLADRDAATIRQRLENSLGRARVAALLAATGGVITDVKAADARLLLQHLRSALNDETMP